MCGARRARDRAGGRAQNPGVGDAGRAREGRWGGENEVLARADHTRGRATRGSGPHAGRARDGERRAVGGTACMGMPRALYHAHGT